MAAKTYNIGIKSKGNSAGDYAGFFFQQGFFSPDGERFYKNGCTRKEVRKYTSFCQRNRLTFFYHNEYGERSTDYRAEYFKHHAPDKNGKYRCAYCGRYFTRQQITIDHIYPVSVVSQNIRLQNRLQKNGITGLNAQENLVAACMPCNRKKSNKTGIWVLRGKLGRSKTLWAFRKLFRLLLLLCVLYLVASLFFPQIRLPFLSFLPVWKL